MEIGIYDGNGRRIPVRLENMPAPIRPGESLISRVNRLEAQLAKPTKPNKVQVTK